VRRIALVAGAVALLAAAALTLNTANAAPRSVQGSLVSMVAATRTIADREEVAAAAARATAATKATSEPTEKPDAAKPAVPKIVIPAGCQQAIANLKALHQADVSEDASERAGQSETSAAAAADRAEDALEIQKWRAALMAARTACVTPATTTCESVIAGLQNIVQTTRTEELAELQAATRDLSDRLADWMRIRTAFAAIPTACARD
jgi:hypothetical protein